MKTTVLAAGTWGITLASLLARKENPVRVYEPSESLVTQLNRTRKHPNLPRLSILPEILITTDLAEALEGSEVIVCVVPAAFMRETCKKIKAIGYKNQIFVICSKGIEKGTHKFLTEILEEELGADIHNKMAIISGPSHAEEVSMDVPTAVVAAAFNPKTAETVRDLFRGPRFRVYTQSDVVGVELAAAVKNVIAIACGAACGLGFGDNTLAALMTRGLYEMMRLGVACGAKPETFMGLAGMGDLIVTCTSPHSRNRRYGEYLGKGVPPELALEKVGMVVEGYYSVQAAVELAKEKKLEMPITEAVAKVLFENVKAAEVVSALMERDPTSEM